MQPFFPTIAVLSDFLPGALGVVAAIAIAFVFITLVSSYYRFQHIVQMAEDTQPEDMGASAIDILRVQLARYLASCARRGTSFSISLIQLNDPTIEVRMGSEIVAAMKRAARIDDVVAVFDGQTAALLTEAEPEDSVALLQRVSASVAQAFPRLSDQIRIGIASYPGHGLSGKDLLSVADEGLLQATAELPIILPKIEDVDAEEEPGEEGAEIATAEENLVSEDDELAHASKSWRDRRKSAILDELTGVLKPSVVSAYMQRLMSDLRHKKKRAALFCIGVNNVEHIARFHGEDAANDVLVGVSRILQGNLRADDLIGRHEKYAFLVLAQASHGEAEIIGRRISTLVQQSEMVSGSKKLKTTITLGVATYPEHGRNLHQLYTAGQKVLDYSRTNDIRAYAVYDPKIHDSMASKPIRSIKSVQA